MRITVDIQGLDETAKAIVETFSQRRMAAVGATALTRTANEIGRLWTRDLESKFDRPTRATTTAVRTQGAKASATEAAVYIKDQASGTPPVEWLSPEERGGARRLKKFEQALQSQGSLPVGSYVVPGPAAKLDGFGNVSRGQLVQVIAQLGAQYSPGYQRVISRSAAKRAQKALLTGRSYVAIIRPTKGLKPGIYERKGRSMLAVFYFVRSIKYRPRTDLIGIANREAPAMLQRHVSAALQDHIGRVIAKGRR